MPASSHALADVPNEKAYHIVQIIFSFDVLALFKIVPTVFLKIFYAEITFLFIKRR